MKFNCLSLKIDDDELFKKGSKISTFFIRPFLTMLNLEVEKISLQQLEYKMDFTNYPGDYNFFEIGYCGHTNFPFSNIQLDHTSDLIPSYFNK